MLRWLGALFFVLLLAADASAQSYYPVVTAGDPGNYSYGFGHAVYWPAEHKILMFFAASHSGKDANNSVRAYYPTTNTWETLFCSEAGADCASGSGTEPAAYVGLPNRDNFSAWFIPALGTEGQLLVSGGIGAEQAPAGSQWEIGLFDPVLKTWVAKDAAVNDVIDNITSLPNHGDPAVAWCNGINKGISFGGSLTSNSTDDQYIIEPKPGGPQAYQLRQFTGSRPAPRTQFENSMVCDGTRYAYMFGGIQSYPADVVFHDLWRFDFQTETWTQLTDYPGTVFPEYSWLPAVVYDSNANAVVVNINGDVWAYDIAGAAWKQISVTVQPSYNHTGVYDPATGVILYEGGNRYPDGCSYCQMSTTGINIDPKTWNAIPLPVFLGGTTGAKHMTGVLNPLDNKMYFTGGDHASDYRLSVPQGTYSSYRQETFTFSLSGASAGATDFGWTLVYPYCGTTGPWQPKNPDYMGWIWDSLRSVFWILPGKYESVSDGANCPDETGGYGDDARYIGSSMLSFDPVNHVWGSDRYPGTPRGGDAGQWGSMYDPVNDQIVTLHYDGGGGTSKTDRFNIADGPSGTWTSTFETGSGLRAVKGAHVPFDPTTRLIYMVDPAAGELWSYHLDTKAFVDLGAIPGGAETVYIQQPEIDWDATDRILFYWRYPLPDRSASGLFGYHPDTAQWETMTGGNFQTINHSGVMAYPMGRIMSWEPHEQALLLFGVVDDIDGTSNGNPENAPSEDNLFVFRYKSATGITAAPAAAAMVKMGTGTWKLGSGSIKLGLTQ